MARASTPTPSACSPARHMGQDGVGGTWTWRKEKGTPWGTSSHSGRKVCPCHAVLRSAQAESPGSDPEGLKSTSRVCWPRPSSRGSL